MITKTTMKASGLENPIVMSIDLKRAKRMGYEFSIQDGKLIFVREGQPVPAAFEDAMDQMGVSMRMRESIITQIDQEKMAELFTELFERMS